MQPQYEILNILGGGSYGTLCVARNRVNGESLAIKVLNRSHVEDTSTLQRTRDEARMLHRLNHPNIVRVHRLFEHDDRPVLAMEYIQGCSFEDLVRRHQSGIPTEVVDRDYESSPCSDSSVQRASWPQPAAHADRSSRSQTVEYTCPSTQGEIVGIFGVARAEFVGREVHNLRQFHAARWAIPRQSMPRYSDKSPRRCLRWV